MAQILNQAVPVGSPRVIGVFGMRLPITVRGEPGASGSLVVEYSCTDTALSSPGTASWSNWPSGTITAASTDSIVSPVVAIRVTATTAAGSVEVVTS